VLEELDAEAETATTSSADLLEAAAQALTSSYRQRAALVRMVPATSLPANTPAEALEATLTSLAASGSSKKDGSVIERLPHELKAAQYLSGDDLHTTIALQRLLIDASARRIAAARPQHAAAARQIAAESLTVSADAGNALIQLRQQESALLKLWMLYAPET
jgi:hypothetical protein